MDRLTPVDLKCEHLAEPCGLNIATPRFTWALEGNGRDRRQTAYRIVVGTVAADVAEARGDIWDSGRVESADTLLVPYCGAPLRSHQFLHWAVEVWSDGNSASNVSAPARFATGLMRRDDWQAQWIARHEFAPIGRNAPVDTSYDNPYRARPADYFRRGFAVRPGLRRATVYATALGVYNLHVNGAKVGDMWLAPGWTDYDKRVEYQLYDITHCLRTGANAIGAAVGEGWYCGRVGFVIKRQGSHYGWRPSFLCQVALEYEDGSREVIASDATWRTSYGPIVYSDLLIGEKYDARLESPGWDGPEFDDANWQDVELAGEQPPSLDAARAQPVRATHELPGRLLHRAPSGEVLFDIGQNLSGVVRLAIKAKTGTVVTLRHAEMLTPEGDLYTINLRSAPATDVYVAAGRGVEGFTPSFTFHGFRYVGVRADGVDAGDIAVTALAVHSDTPLAGRFACGSEMVNKLVSNILWSQRGNFLSIPTDCPQRDERLGWTADAQIFAPTAGYNMDVAAFFDKWLLDLRDSQMEDGAFPDVAPVRHYIHSDRHVPKGAPAWGDAGVILPWMLYLRYGDRELLERMWQPMCAWMEYVARHNPDYVRVLDVNRNYGDWLSVGPATPKPLMATAYWAHIADLMARMAAILGRRQEQATYAALFAAIRAAFMRAFVEADGKLQGDTQSAYLVALDFGLADGDAEASFVRHLLRTIDAADGHLQTGFLGVRHLCPVLARHGAVDRAYRLLLNEDYPSWGFSIRHGATSIWERWDGWTPERGFQSANMNSFNHYAYGAVGEWLFGGVAGIGYEAERPAFRRIRLRPLPNRALGWCEAEYRGHLGTIASEWRYEGDMLHLAVTIPANCDAELVLPAAAGDAVRLDGRALADALGAERVTRVDGQVAMSLGSGRYTFTLQVEPEFASKTTPVFA